MEGLVFANLAATAAVLFILLFRKIFIEKVYPKVFVLLWMLVVLRLLLPFEFSSGISLYSFEEEKQTALPKTEIVFEEEKLPEKIPEKNENIIFEKNDVQKAGISKNEILFFVWLSGSLLTGCFFAAKHFYLVKKLLKNSALFEEVPEEFKDDNIRFYKNKTLCSPLSFGVFKPVIILPEDISEKHLTFVLLHEYTHIKDRDSVLKILALFALALNWFNPFVWFMVKMLDRDIERYCDERVLKKLGGKNALSYANTILDFAEKESLSLSFFSAASLCERVTSIMKNKNKKQSVFMVISVFAAAIFTMTACGTVPKEPEKEPVSGENLSEIFDNMNKTPEEFVYFNENEFSSDFIWPCSETVVTSKMDEGRNHNGIDIGQNQGSEIFAAADGTVYIAGEYLTEYGLTVTIDHKENFTTLYAHCSEIYVKKGDKVKAGELIARTGSTGSSTGPHLHFEIHKGKTNLNPEDVFLLKEKTKTITVLPSIPEDMQGYNGEESPPNNYIIESFIFSEEDGIEKIIVKGFGFSKEASINVICIPSNETKISVGYGNELQEAGFAVSKENGNVLLLATKEEVLNVSESFDLRIWADFEKVSLEIENFGYSVFEGEEFETIPETEEKHAYAVKDFEGYKVPMTWPCESVTIVSKFGSYKGHTGMDIFGERGETKIYAAGAGTVVVSKRENTGYGNYIIIDHGNGVQTLYAHCHELFAKQGQKVEAGETIATVGATGNSTGSHLHFELRHRGVYVDPEEYILPPEIAKGLSSNYP